MKICIIIPTLNEEKNILKIIKKIKNKIDKRPIDILFIDDNSEDNTQEIIEKLKKKNKNLKYIFRKKKMGIGSAHKEGFKFAYKRKYDLIITMDCDGTHDPKYFDRMINAALSYDYILTSRFKKKNLLIDWPFSRKLLTHIRHFLVKIFLKINYDASGAFRCFYTSKVKLRDLLLPNNNDYAYFWELTYILNKKEYSIYEIPVRLVYRKLGKSKMKFKHIIGSLIYLIKIFFIK